MELKRYVEIIWRRKWILIFCSVLLPLFAYAMMKLIAPIYKSEAKIWVLTSAFQQRWLRDIPDAVGKFDFTSSANVIGTLEEILNNSSAIEQVITDLKLTNRKGQKPTPDEFFDPNKLSLMLHLTEKGVAEKNLTDTDVLMITGYSTTPAEAREIADRVVGALRQTFSAIYGNAVLQARVLLQSRLTEVGMELSEANDALQEYRIQHNVYDLSTQTSILLSEISTLEYDRAKVQRAQQGAEADLSNLRNSILVDPKDIKDFPVQVEDGEIMDTYKALLLTSETALAKLLTERTEEHPDVISQRQQVAVVQDKLRKEMAKSFASLLTGRYALYDRLSTKYTDSLFAVIESTAHAQLIEEQIRAKQERLREIPRLEREVNDLQWKIDRLKATNDALKVNIETARSAEKLDLTNILLVQAPTMYANPKDNQYFPPKSTKVAVLVAAFLGGCFGLFLVFLVEYWNGGEPRPDKAQVTSATEERAEQT